MFGFYYMPRFTPVFGDPSAEAHVFEPSLAKNSPAEPTQPQSTETLENPGLVGTVVGKKGAKLLVKMALSGEVLEVPPTDVERVLQPLNTSR